MHAHTAVDERAQRVAVTGDITAADAAAIERAPAAAVVSLDSAGGSIYAAIDMGRVIRKKGMTVEVASDARCFSSCALLYFAGVVRRNDGVVGLHRPYLVGEPHSARRIARALPKMFDDVRAFVVEMGVRSEVADLMIHTPPEGMRRFEGDAIATLVPSVDPVYDEIRVAREARTRALTTDAYRRLELTARRQCSGHAVIEAAERCRDAVLATRAEPAGSHAAAAAAAPLAGSLD